MKKEAIVIHSGGMDSSICLATAINDFQRKKVLSLSFQYGQRHSNELEKAREISKNWGVDHVVLSIDCLQEITENALMDSTIEIAGVGESHTPNTLVVGRNGLMARLGAIHAQNLGAHCVYMGVIEVEEANSGYRDCSRRYMDLMEEILRMDLDDPEFSIRTPLVKMTKKETMELAYKQGILEYLLDETITCYKGISHLGCQECPACELRNEGIQQFKMEHPDFTLPKAYSALG